MTETTTEKYKYVAKSGDSIPNWAKKENF